MPKARKTKKSKRSIKRPKKKNKKPAKEDGRPADAHARELLLKVIDRFGASVTVSQADPDVLIVKSFNSRPFAIYWNKCAIEDVTPEEVRAATVAPPAEAVAEKAAE